MHFLVGNKAITLNSHVGVIIMAYLCLKNRNWKIILFLFFVIILLPSPSYSELNDKCFGLIIGIENYPYISESHHLEFAETDAKAVNDIFSKKFPTYLLIGEDANGDRIRRELNDIVFKSKSKPLDMFLLYYSGHGTFVNDNNNDEPDGFDEAIVPYDASLDNKQSLLLDDEINTILSSIVARQILVVLDSCYSGYIAKSPTDTNINDFLANSKRANKFDRMRNIKSISITPQKERTAKSIGIINDFGRDLTKDTIKRNIIVISATASNMRAFEDKSLKHGILTYFFLNEIRKSKDDTPIGIIFKNVQAEVDKYFKNQNDVSLQTPQILGYSQWFSWAGNIHAPLGWNAGGFSTANTNVCDISSIRYVRPEDFLLSDTKSLEQFNNYASGNTADLDKTGELEMIFTRGNTLIITDIYGDIIWTKKFPNNISLNLVDDFDGDLIPEIALSSREDSDPKCIIVDSKGKERLSFLIKGNTYKGKPDSGLKIWEFIDFNGDGIKEVLFSVSSGYSWKPRAIFIYDPVKNKIIMKFSVGPSINSVNVKDFDNDGRYEIVIGSYGPGNGNVENHGAFGKSSDHASHIFVIKDDGKLIFQRAIAGTFTGIRTAVEDIDGDGQWEIVGCLYAAAKFRPDVGAVIVFDHRGKIISLYRHAHSILSYAVANFLGDSKKEIVFSDRNGRLFILNNKLDELFQSNLLNLKKKNYSLSEDYHDFISIPNHSVKSFKLTKDFRPDVEEKDRDKYSLGGNRLRIEVANDINGDGLYELIIYKWYEDPISLNPRGDMGIKNEIHYYDMRLMILSLENARVDVWRSFNLEKYQKKPKSFRCILSDIQNDGLVDIILFSDVIQYFSSEKI